MLALAAICRTGELSLWEEVPQNVATLYKESRPVVDRVRSIAKLLPKPKDGVRLWWHPKNKRLNISMPDGTDAATENRWSNALQTVPGIKAIAIDYEWVPEDCVEVKYAAELNWLGNAWQSLHKPFGGPRPLTNTLLGGLLLGGLGYGTGSLLESLFPERYMERGKLRKTLAIAGGAAGAVPGLVQGHIYSKLDGTSLPTAMLTPESAPLKQGCDDSPMQKFADMFGEQLASQAGGFGIQSIPVDAFNRMVWRDVRKGSAEQTAYGSKSPWGDNSQSLHTPAPIGAATTGLMVGVQQQTGSRLVSPGDIVRTIASAGVGLATANTVGRTLGALAGLTPAAQEKLQDVGIFGGLLTSVVPALFGN